MGVILFIVASAVVATRLLLLYRRLRQPPELFLGLAYLLAGTLGWGGLLAGTVTTPPGQTLSEGYQAWSAIVGDIGTFCFYLFVWYVFRRESLVAKAALGLALALFLVSLVHDTFLAGVTFGPPPPTTIMLCGATARAAVYPWMAIEAFAQYFAFRKRARIGLGNPLVKNRLLLWGISAVLTFTISAVATVLYIIASDTVDATAKQNQAGTLYGILAALSSIVIWLAFFPPKAYRAWLEKSAQPEPRNG